MSKKITNLLDEKIPVLVKGHFKIQSIDAKTGKVLQEYEDYNKVVIWVYQMFASIVYGYSDTSLPEIEDFMIHSFAIGTNGVEPNGELKPIEYNSTKLYSETNFWDTPDYTGEERNAYVYQATFAKPSTVDTHFSTKYNEGATYPAWSLGEPKAYRGTPYNSEHGVNGALSIRRSFSNSILRQEFYLGTLAGNGHPMWDEAPEFSEAALYMPKNATAKGDSLGTLFSMKTFPKMKKTDACVIKINWNLDFSID